MNCFPIILCLFRCETWFQSFCSYFPFSWTYFTMFILIIK